MRVLKVGGRPQGDPALVEAIAEAHRVAPGTTVIVHGGGDEVSSLQRLYGVTAEFKGGRRVTSCLDLEIIRMALSGSANKRLVSALVGAGVPAVGLSGEDAALLTAHAVDLASFGFVGHPAAVNAGLIAYLCAGGFVPVISPVSRNADASEGHTLNVNGDDAAAAIAIAMEADELLLVSDVEGVLDGGAMIAKLDLERAQQLIDDGIAIGGMSAKVQAATTALEGGVQRVRISDIAAINCVDRGTSLTQVGSLRA